jgi:hypothetical protein
MSAGEMVLKELTRLKRCGLQPSDWLGVEPATGGRPAQRRARRGAGDQFRGRLQLFRIPLLGVNAGISCARHRAQGNRANGACLLPAGGRAIVVVQRATNVHVGLRAPGYLLSFSSRAFRATAAGRRFVTRKRPRARLKFARFSSMLVDLCSSVPGRVMWPLVSISSSSRPLSATCSSFRGKGRLSPRRNGRGLLPEGQRAGRCAQHRAAGLGQ